MRINLKQRGANAKKKIDALCKGVSLWPRPRRARGANPQLFKLEREIGGIADRIHNKRPPGKTARNVQAPIAKSLGTISQFHEISTHNFATKIVGNARVALAIVRGTITQLLDITHKFAGKTVANLRGGIAKLRGTITRLLELSARKFAAGYTYLKARILLAAASTRNAMKVMNVAIRGTVLSRKPHPSRRIKREVTTKNAGGRKSRSRPVSALETFVFAALFGLLFVCTSIIVILFLQLRQAKTEIAGWQKRLSDVNVRLDQVEKTAQRKDSQEAVAPPEHTDNKIALSDEDEKVIRQYIRVLPPKSPSKAEIHLGDKVSNAVPIPDALIDQMPKLQGDRFSIDQNGAIVILRAGSDRVGAIVPP